MMGNTDRSLKKAPSECWHQEAQMAHCPPDEFPRSGSSGCPTPWQSER